MTAPRKRGGSRIESPGDWIGYRHSLANVYRRVAAGELLAAIEVCSVCETETDVRVPVHSPRCRLGSGV